MDVWLKELADHLLGWSGVQAVGAKDVLVWQVKPKMVGVAFRGPALHLQSHAVQKEIRNYQYSLDLGLQRALGFPAETRGFGRELSPVVQTMSDRETFIGDLLEAVEGLSREFLGGDDVTDVQATLMPDEGEPWSPDHTPTEWYSAKKKKAFVTKDPPWIGKVQDREGAEQWGADFCYLAGHASCGGKQVVMSIGGTEVLLTHCTSVESWRALHVDGKSVVGLEGRAKLIQKCGGLLFPSLACSFIPATNFGTLVLVADPMLALAGLRPYKKRGIWPITIYALDAWTETTSGFMGYGAAQLFDELTGNLFVTNWIYKRWMWTLGPPFEEEKSSRIDSTKALLSRLKTRSRKFSRELDRDGFDKLHEQDERYPYLEAKANSIVEPGCFPLAVCQERDQKLALKWLHESGFKLKLIVLTDEPIVPGRDVNWDYAWRVRDVVLAYAHEKPNERIFDVVT